VLTTYDNPLAVIMLHIGTKINPNPKLNPTCSTINNKTRCGALFM